MDKIIAKYDLLTEAEKRVCNYIFENIDEIKDININELAKKMFTSKTVVINMSKKLGFAGFVELKYYLKNNDNSKKSNKNKSDIFKIIEMNKNLINTETIKSASKKIINANTVYIAARGTSKTCALHLSRLLLIIGIKCILIDDYNLLTLAAKKVDKRELFVLISLSGETAKILETAKIVKSRQAKIISITSFTHNSLAKLSDINLYVASDSFDTSDNDDNSRIGIFILIEILFDSIKNLFENKKNI